MGEKCSPQPLGHLAFADDAGESSDGAGPASDPNVGMLAHGIDVRGDDAPRVCGWQFDQVSLLRWLFVEHCLERRFLNDLEVERVFGAIEFGFDFDLGEMCEIERPDTNLGDLERIEDIHGHCISPLVREVATDARAESLVGLADVDRFAVVIVESIDAALRAADAPTFGIGAAKKIVNLATDCRDISRLFFRRSLGAGVLFGRFRSGRCGAGFVFLGLRHGR